MKNITRDEIKNTSAVILSAIYGIMAVFAVIFFYLSTGFSTIYEVVIPFRFILWAIYVCGIVGTIIMLIKIKDVVKKPIALILVLVITVGAYVFATMSANNYFSEYTREKWDKYPLLRLYMTDDLESKYNFIGMSEEEVIEILGEPWYIEEDGKRTLMYEIGRAMIDPYVFFLEIEDGVVTKTRQASYG